MEKTSSFLISLLLHGIILFAIVSYPVSRVVDLKKQSYQVSLVVGTGGKDVPVSKVLGPKPKPQAKPQAPKPSVKKPEPAKAVPVQTKPAPKPAVEEKKAVSVPAKVEEAKPATKPVAQAKETPKPAPKPVAKPAPPPPPPSAVSSVLADLQALSQSQASSNADSSAAEGDGGGGIKDVYISQVMLAVQENWSIPIYDREQYITEVLVHIDADGKILDARIESSSGRADFDASALNALERMTYLPAPPPIPDLYTLTLVFNSLQ